MSMLDSILRVVNARIAKLDTHALYGGTVVKQTSDGLLEVKMDDDRFGEGFQHLEIAYGLPGITADIPKGTRVGVGFLDGKRNQPIVRHWLDGDGTNVTINVTGTLKLGPTPRLASARQTDAVQAGPFTGAITGGSTKVTVG